MKRTIAFVLAAALVTVGVPSLAHEAAYPSECDNPDGAGYCQSKEAQGNPAHEQCTGERNWMTADRENLARESIGIAGSEGGVVVYAYAPGDQAQQDATGAPMPGLLWVEDNGFSGMQRTDWRCKSHVHENADEWTVHADKVLI